MEQLNKVLNAFELCPKHGCIDCPYFTAYEECNFESLAEDAKNVINQLLKERKDD